MDHTHADHTFPVRRPSPVVTPARLTPVYGSATRPSEQRGVKGLRLTTRGRVVFASLALVVALPTIGFGGQAFASAPSAPVATVEHTIESGDTLWSLAGRVAGPGEDIRDVVAQLKELNGLENSAIFAGQTLLLPKD